MASPFTRDELEAEVAEKSADLQAFLQARDIIRARVVEVKDSKSKVTPLLEWSGTAAVLGSLDLSIHAMERTIEELKQLLANQSERPRFEVIDGGQE